MSELAYSLHLGSDKNRKNISKQNGKNNLSGTTSLPNNAIQNVRQLSKVDKHNYRKYDNEQELIEIVRGTSSPLDDVKKLYLSEFEEDYYVNDFNYLKNYINKHNLENIFMDMIYLIGYVMGINNMFKVRDNNSYIEVVSNAHDKVNDLSVEDFFKLFGLDMEDMFYFDLVDNVLKFVGEVGIYLRKRLG